MAIGSVALALVVRWLLDPVLEHQVPYVTVFSAVLILVVAVRPGPFLAAAASGWLGAYFLFVEPRLSFSTAGPAEVVEVVLSGVALAAAAIAAWLAARVRDRHARAEVELARRSEELRLVTDAMPALISYIDEQRRYRFANRGYERWFGQRQEDLIGRHLRDVLGESAFERVRPHMDAAFAGKRHGYETQLPYRDGGPRWVRAEYVPDVDPSGRVLGVYALVTDISERRRAELERDRFFELSVDMLAIASTDDGRWHRVNPAFTEILGWSQHELLEMPFIDVVHPDDQPASLQARSPLGRGDPLTDFEHRVRCKDGSYKWIAWHTSPSPDDRLIYCVGRDATDRKAAEEQLRASRDRQKIAAEAAGFGIFEWRVRADEAMWENERMYAIFGRSHAAGPINRREFVEEYLHPDDRDGFEHALADGIQPGKLFRTECRIRLKGSSEVRCIEFAGRFAVAPDGTPETLTGVVADVTDRSRAAADLQFQKHALDQSSIVAMTDIAGTITYVNDKFCEISGYARRELLGQNHRLLNSGFHPHEFFLEMYAHISTGNVWRGEIRNRRKDGTHYWVDTTIVPALGDGGRPERYVAIRTDITERKQAEEELRTADRQKDEFLAMLAHELRNPLAAIRTAQGLLAHSRDDPARFEQITDILGRQSRQLARLIDDLLDISRITHGKIQLDLEPVDLAAVLDEAVEASRPLAARGGQTIRISRPDQPVRLHADAMRLTQVFGNLIDNACKYSGRGSTVEVTSRTTDGRVAVAVKDSGVGIPPEKLRSIFDMFSQVDSSPEQSRGGLGIGLTLTKRLVELHGGTIEARSDGVGHGSEFVVELPLPTSDTVPATGPLPTQGHRSTERRRILVVDDNEDVADSLAMLLHYAGHEVRTAGHGRDALALADAEAPEVVLLDIGLPEMSGYDVCRALRERPWGGNVVVVALTGWGQEGDRRKSFAAGFDAHLVKPVDPKSLHETLDELLRSRRP